MDPDALKLRRLTERVLRDGGALSLSVVLEQLVPVRRLRELAQKLGLSPKGFRVERAPARSLAGLLADLQVPAQMDEVVALLAAGAMPGAASEGDDGGAVAGAVDAQAALQFREQEVHQLRNELERAREGSVRAQEREAVLRQAAERDTEQIQRLRGELARQSRPPAASDAVESSDRELQHRIHDLEQEVQARHEQDEALRRQLAVERTRIRELEDEVAELAALLPKGRRRKAPVEPPLPPSRRFVLPYFLPSFYRSLDGRDRRDIERALRAILLFCTEGHAYPSLDVKQLGGQDLWSLRASLGLRVYFRQREDGDVEFLELADREEQNTTLRRLKDR